MEDEFNSDRGLEQLCAEVDIIPQENISMLTKINRVMSGETFAAMSSCFLGVTAFELRYVAPPGVRAVLYSVPAVNLVYCHLIGRQNFAVSATVGYVLGIAVSAAYDLLS